MREEKKPVELPQRWNLEELKQRLGDVEFFVEEDFTTMVPGGEPVYTPAKVYLPADKLKDFGDALKQPYEKSQAELREEERKANDPFEQLKIRVEALEIEIAKLRGESETR
jgi:prefoldin subunit 5